MNLKGQTRAPLLGVHRFHDKVACHAGDGATVYLTPDDAIQVAHALLRAAESCQRESFRESPNRLTWE